MMCVIYTIAGIFLAIYGASVNSIAICALASGFFITSGIYAVGAVIDRKDFMRR